MKKLLIAILVLSVLLFGCVQTSTVDTGADKPVVAPEKPAATAEQPKAAPESPAAPPAKAEAPKSCDLNVAPETLDKIDLTIFTEGLQKTAEGIKFRLLPQDKSGKVIPITGNLKIAMWTTKKMNGQMVEDTEVYTKSFNLKKENAMPDCGTQELLISFADVKASGKYPFVKAEDMGIIRFEFKKTGSDTLYEKKFSGPENTIRIWP